MFVVFAVLLVILFIAVTVVLLVALPQLRSGNEILTEDGKQAVARAGQVARTGLGVSLVGQRRAPPESGPIPAVPAVPAVQGAPVVIDLREPSTPGTPVAVEAATEDKPAR